MTKSPFLTPLSNFVKFNFTKKNNFENVFDLQKVGLRNKRRAIMTGVRYMNLNDKNFMPTPI